MRDRLVVHIEMHDAGLDVGDLNVIASPLQTMRDVFDVMATESDEDWALINRRLSDCPSVSRGTAMRCAPRWQPGMRPPPGRSTRGIEQAGQIQQLLVDMVADAAPDNTTLHDELLQRAAAAADAYAELAAVLRDDIAPHARAKTRSAGTPTGCCRVCTLAPPSIWTRPTEWGLRQLEDIVAEQESIAARLYPGASVTETLRRLDDEPRYLVHGVDALQAWMQDLSDRAVESLADTHFDIAAPLRRLECRIAPTQTGGIYYTGPSEDLTRPGRMWWSVPPGVDTFRTWQETTTVFHEGVPGHHLQIGRAVVVSDRLNRWRRLGCWVSGHGEGWALYAERLMAELGWLDDAGNRMGMLDAQRFRAARVVIDIGVHCGLKAPDGGVWDAGTAWVFLQSHSAHDRGDTALRAGPLPWLARPGAVVRHRPANLAATARRDGRPGRAREGIPQPCTRSRRAAAGRAAVGVGRRFRRS